jgi:hypothetical protein
MRVNESAGLIPSTGLSRDVEIEMSPEALKDAKTTEEGKFAVGGVTYCTGC